MQDRERGAAPTDVAAQHRQGRGGPGGGRPGAPGPPPQFVVGMPTVNRPPNARDFNLFGTLTARTSANTPALFPTAQFEVPRGNVAVIRAISILANALLVTSDIRWTLLYNEAPVSGWTGLTINPRAAGSVEVSWTPEETYIDVIEAATIDWRVEVLDAGTYQLSIGYHGWFYSQGLAYQAAQAWGA